MKKIFWTFVALLVICGAATVQAQNSKPAVQDSQQVEDQFMVSVFEKDIQKAVSNYYKENSGTSESIMVMYNWNKDNVVKILQSEKGQVLETPYVVQFVVNPYASGKLGSDTLTFGVIPKNQQGQLEVNLLEYNHKDPEK